VKRLFAQYLILAGMLTGALGAVACNDENHATKSASVSPKSKHAVVTRVVDGDTIKVKIDGIEKGVRLIGIDTPETHKPGVKVECGGPEASAYMTELAPKGATVTLTPDPTQDSVDRYGRILAYAKVHGQELQLEQIYAGNAKVYVYKKPFERVDEFRKAEQVAKDAHRGVWGHCDGDFHSNQPGN
jgi:micrococcal nuclease